MGQSGYFDYRPLPPTEPSWFTRCDRATFFAPSQACTGVNALDARDWSDPAAVAREIYDTAEESYTWLAQTGMSLSYFPHGQNITGNHSAWIRDADLLLASYGVAPMQSTFKQICNPYSAALCVSMVLRPHLAAERDDAVRYYQILQDCASRYPSLQELSSSPRGHGSEPQSSDENEALLIRSVITSQWFRTGVKAKADLESTRGISRLIQASTDLNTLPPASLPTLRLPKSKRRDSHQTPKVNTGSP